MIEAIPPAMYPSIVLDGDTDIKPYLKNRLPNERPPR